MKALLALLLAVNPAFAGNTRSAPVPIAAPQVALSPAPQISAIQASLPAAIAAAPVLPQPIVAQLASPAAAPVSQEPERRAPIVERAQKIADALGRPPEPEQTREVGVGIPTERWPEASPRARRVFLTAAIGGALAAPAAAAGPIAAHPMFVGAPEWTAGTIAAFAAAAAVLGVWKVYLSLATVRFARASMKGAQPKFPRNPLLLIPMLAAGAAVEEYGFRHAIPLILANLASTAASMPAAGLYAVSTLAAAMIFSRLHGYGNFWSRVVGASWYSALYALSGTIYLPIAVHFLHNLILVLADQHPSLQRYLRWREPIGSRS